MATSVGILSFKEYDWGVLSKKATILELAQRATRESKRLDFKRGASILSAELWCEVVKDIVAFANSGGGGILFGVDDDGTNSGVPVDNFLSLDVGTICDKVERYTNFHSIEVDIIEIIRQAKQCALLLIGGVEVPIVFTSPGTYLIDNPTGKQQQKTAFARGTIYFRHGAKSAPGTHADMVAWRDSEVERVKNGWMGNMRSVVEAPIGHVVTMTAPASSYSKDQDPMPANITSDPSAIKVIPGNMEKLFPHKGIVLIAEVNRRTKGQPKMGPYDLQCINAKIDTFVAHRDFGLKPHPQSSPQYSDKYVEWIVEQVRSDGHFFYTARAEMRAKKLKALKTRRF